MFDLTIREMNKIAEETKFPRDTLEKVLRLGDILQFMNRTSPMKDHLALKGGTAIHLTVFPLLRLSVDIDLDFHASVTKDEMVKIRNQITDLLKRYMSSQEYQLSDNSKYSHTLDSFVFKYRNLSGNPDNITIEINYSNRAHLFDLNYADIKTEVLSGFRILTVSKMDLFGSKISALIDRTTPRDVYDVYQMIIANIFHLEENSLLKKSVLFYLSLSIDNLNLTESLDNTNKKINEMSYREIKRTLVPVLKRGETFDIHSASKVIKEFLIQLLVLTADETTFIEQFNIGIYLPLLLFSEEEIINRIKSHPMALWKVIQRSSQEV